MVKRPAVTGAPMTASQCARRRPSDSTTRLSALNACKAAIQIRGDFLAMARIEFNALRGHRPLSTMSLHWRRAAPGVPTNQLYCLGWRETFPPCAGGHSATKAPAPVGAIFLCAGLG